MPSHRQTLVINSRLRSYFSVQLWSCRRNMKRTDSGGGESGEAEKKKYWLSCILLRNLPPAVSQLRIAEWVVTTLRHQPTRIAFVDEDSSGPDNSGSYIVELSPQSVLNIFASHGHKLQHIFPLNIRCEEVRSEAFALNCFSDSSQLSNGKDTLLSKRCLIVRQCSPDSFPVTKMSLTQLFQGCLGEKVKRVVALKSKSRGRNRRSKKMIVEFSAEDSVQCIMISFNEESSSLDVPIRIKPVSRRSGNAAKKLLSKVDMSLPAHSQMPGAMKAENQHVMEAEKSGRSPALLESNILKGDNS
eukprot:scaffold3046_cov105-Cylindrotheca_fusiformis.AAC.5